MTAQTFSIYPIYDGYKRMNEPVCTIHQTHAELTDTVLSILQLFGFYTENTNDEVSDSDDPSRVTYWRTRRQREWSIQRSYVSHRPLQTQS